MNRFQLGDTVVDIKTGKVLTVRKSIPHARWKGGGCCTFIESNTLVTSWARLRLIETEDLENV